MLSDRLFDISDVYLYFGLISFSLGEGSRFRSSSICCPVKLEGFACVRDDSVIVVDVEIVGRAVRNKLQESILKR